jgi:hypothetical protein
MQQGQDGKQVRRPRGGIGAVERWRRLASLSFEAQSLLVALGAVRVLSPQQAQALVGPRATRALAELRRAELVWPCPYRPHPQAPLVRVHALTPRGARLAHEAALWREGEGVAPLPPARGRWGDLSYLFLSHALEVSQLYVSLAAALGTGGFRWRGAPGTRITYRSLLVPTGKGVLMPDALVGPPDRWEPDGAPPSGRTVAVEVDRATMGPRAMSAKLARYRELFAYQGEEWPGIPSGAAVWTSICGNRIYRDGRWVQKRRPPPWPAWQAWPGLPFSDAATLSQPLLAFSALPRGNLAIGVLGLPRTGKPKDGPLPLCVRGEKLSRSG